MPLLKKKPHKLLEPPNDLKPYELVYQVRLTNEIFRDYQYPSSTNFFFNYVSNICLLLVCAVSGKINELETCNAVSFWNNLYSYNSSKAWLFMFTNGHAV